MEDISNNKSQVERVDCVGIDTLTDMPSFEEHVQKKNEEIKLSAEEIREIEENITEMEDPNARIFIAGRTNGINANPNSFGGYRCKVRSETGEIVDRKMSEKYAIWRLAKDIADSWSREDPKSTRMKALRDFSVLSLMWENGNKTLAQQRKDCAVTMLTSMKQLRRTLGFSNMSQVNKFIDEIYNYENSLNRLNSIDEVELRMIPYREQYEQYEYEQTSN